MRRVFLIERPRSHIDLAKAAEFGELTYVFNPDDRRDSVFSCNGFVSSVLKRLKQLNFDTHVDVFCIAGSMVPITISAAAILCVYGHLDVLLYNAREGAYILRSLEPDVWMKGQIDVEKTGS